MLRSRRLLVVVLLLGLASLAHADVGAPPAAWLAGQVTTLASPSMDGRRSGTPGGDLAARYLADALASFGVRPAGDDASFFQSFVVSAGTRLAQPTTIELIDPAAPRFEVGRDWMPHGGSPNADVTGDIVFVGADSGRDVRGKIVVVTATAPDTFVGAGSSRLDRLIAAREDGAAAVLLVEDTLSSLDATATRVDLPSASITGATADALRAHTHPRVRLRITLGREDRRAANVVGVLPGTDPALGREAVVIGAHYDHLGRAGGELHPGADDNASGTAVTLGLARAFASAGAAPRTLVFALFGGEELGLLGSRHYVAHPAVPMERTVAMLNFDMVGRLRDGRLSVGGVDSGRTLRALVADAAAGQGLTLQAHGNPYAPSDHVRFYGAGAPVLFFYTGNHADYHRPTDTADKIDADGMARIAAMAARVVEHLAADARPAYVKLPAPERSRATARAGASGASAFFGVVADGQTEADGVHVAGVMPGSAAARLGLAEGDVIVRFADTSIRGFTDLRDSVRKHRPGDRVDVVFLRDGAPRRGSETLGVGP